MPSLMAVYIARVVLYLRGSDSALLDQVTPTVLKR